MSGVLVGQSYFLRFDPKLHRAMRPQPPLGSLWAAAAIREPGHSVQVFDAMLAESEDEWNTALEQARPRFAVLFEDNFNYLSKMCLLRMRQAAFRMIAMATDHLCEVIVCGSDATDHSRQYLEQGADFVLVGEGEATLIELLAARTQQPALPVDAIAGLRFLAADGSLRDTGNRPLLSDLDALPTPARDLIDIERYASIWRQRHGVFSLNMATTRGCPFHCNWCAKPIWGQAYHSRSPEHVVAEMNELVELYGVEHIEFADDIMGLQPGWLERFADCLGEAAVRVPYKCLSRADLLLREGEIDALQRSGCDTVWMGAESGSQKILDAMEKGTTIEQVEEASHRLRQAGIGVGLFLQFGYPGETRDNIDQTRYLVRRCAPDEIGISVSYPLPGTKFHDRVREQLGTQRNWVDSEDMAMLYAGPFSSAFYRQLHRVVQFEFRRDRALAEAFGSERRPASARRRPLRCVVAATAHSLRLPLERWRLGRLERHSQRGPQLAGQPVGREEAAIPSPQTNPPPIPRSAMQSDPNSVRLSPPQPTQQG